jgi:hypothetical protein
MFFQQKRNYFQRKLAENSDRPLACKMPKHFFNHTLYFCILSKERTAVRYECFDTKLIILNEARNKVNRQNQLKQKVYR